MQSVTLAQRPIRTAAAPEGLIHAVRLAAAEQAAAAAWKRSEALAQELRQQRELSRRLAESFRCPAPEVPGVTLETCYQPASRAELVGGDFLDFFEPSPGKLALVLGDVCGKGIDAASGAAVTRNMLRAYALEEPSPGAALRRLNRALCAYPAGGPAFVTLIYAILDLATFRLTYANAGHPPALMAQPENASCQLASTGGALGVEPSWRWEDAAVSLRRAGAMAMFSDGLIEARRGPELLGLEAVERHFLRRFAMSDRNLAEALRDEAGRFAGGDLNDDLAIIVVRRPGKARP